MPFQTGARIVLTNDSTVDVSMVFYDLNVTHLDSPLKDAGYLHAFWNRQPKVPIGEPYEILPFIKGRGRFLGNQVNVIGDPLYAGSGWCEGEVKFYLDGETSPTLVGTGTEDYMGSGWGSGVYFNRYFGSSIADDEHSQWAFYRLHVPDPILFDSGLRVTIDDMGGDETANVRRMVAKGAKVKPVTVAHSKFTRILDEVSFPTLDSPEFPEGWVNFYRSDDFCSTAYFYLDKPTSNLPALAPLSLRTANLDLPKTKEPTQ
jgi:hypothetical protein